MTTLAQAPAPSLLPSTRPAPGFGARFALSWRLVRRGAALMWLTAAAYMAIEVLVFRSAYPDAASRQKLLDLSSSTVVRMMQGAPGAVNTAGGFAVWDGGWMLMIIVACWSLLTATRLIRGEEDSGRAELVLCRPLTASQALVAHLVAMITAAAGVGLAAALPFVVLGEPVAGAALWGLGLGALCAVSAALGALLAQLVEPRRRAVSVGLGLLAAAFVLRVVANSADRRIWLLTVAPFGWVERLRAYSANDWPWLLTPLAAIVLLTGAALSLCGRRDTGAALVRSSGTHRSTFRLLGSAPGFGWRLSSGALLAWAVTLAVVTFVFGLMTGALVDFIKEDETYRKMLESMGMDMSLPAVGYLSYIAVFLALPFAAFLGWRVGVTRQEEAEGRLDNLLVRGVVRWRWLAATAASAVLAASILVATTTAALWAGTQLVDAPVTTGQILRPMLGTMPVVVLFAGIAVLTFGVAPRLTVAMPVTLAVLGYLLDTFGTVLNWPNTVLGASPFHHLARLPSDPMTLGSAFAMTAIGVAAAAVGVIAFTRRDLRGA
jgi:ABC-2 type transport system permease protein